MTVSESLRKKAEQDALESIAKVVNSSPNPELAKVILFTAWDKRGLFLDSGCEMLQVPRNEFDGVIAHLVSAGVASIPPKEEHDKEGRFRKVVDDPAVEQYLRSDVPYGPYKFIADLCLDREKTLRAMNSVEGLVRFNYSRTFRFEDLKKLRQLRDQVHRNLEAFRRGETAYWHSQLGVLMQFSGFPSFVREVDPTKTEDGHYDQKDFNLRGKFDSPEEAFRVGFDHAGGYPIASKSYQVSPATQLDSFPHAISIERVGDHYKFSLDNIMWHVNTGCSNSPFAYRQEALQIMPKIRERLAAVLNQ